MKRIIVQYYKQKDEAAIFPGGGRPAIAYIKCENTGEIEEKLSQIGFYPNTEWNNFVDYGCVALFAFMTEEERTCIRMIDKPIEIKPEPFKEEVIVQGNGWRKVYRDGRYIFACFNRALTYDEVQEIYKESERNM